MIEPVLSDLHVMWGMNTAEDFHGYGHVYIDSSDGQFFGAVFQVRIVTMKHVMRELQNGSAVIDGRGTYMFDTFDEEALIKRINQHLKYCIRPTWREVIDAVNRYLIWEYDMTDHDYGETIAFMKSWGIMDQFEADFTPNGEYTCGVCGFWGLDYPQFIDGLPNYNICPCCGFQAGFHDDDQGLTIHEYRQKWIDGGGAWSHPQEQPNGWNLQRQLKRVGYLLEEKREK